VNEIFSQDTQLKINKFFPFVYAIRIFSWLENLSAFESLRFEKIVLNKWGKYCSQPSRTSGRDLNT
jgi:hypothetical protein